MPFILNSHEYCLTLLAEMTSNLFFQLLRYSLGITDEQPANISDEQWQELFDSAVSQAIVGLLYQGVQRLPQSQQPQNRRLKLTWHNTCQAIIESNRKLCQHVADAISLFEQAGFDCCLLKGQGNALLYPNPLFRTPGDIDLWVTRNGKLAIRDAISYVRQTAPKAGKTCYHHIEAGKHGGTDIEIHYRPSFKNSPFHNHHLQQFFITQLPQQLAHQVEIGGRRVSVPTLAFNRIFVIDHISRHILHEGIGLRQFIDCYYVLRQGFTPEEKEETADVLRRCGLYTTATAIMYVMREVFWLDEAHLLVPPDEKRGRFLLNEIIQGGNFGTHDKRVSRFARENAIGRNLQRLRHDLRTLFYFPSESLWEPTFRIYHFFWRLTH